MQESAILEHKATTALEDVMLSAPLPGDVSSVFGEAGVVRTWRNPEHPARVNTSWAGSRFKRHPAWRRNGQSINPSFRT
jgi:hypothetical protein